MEAAMRHGKLSRKGAGNLAAPVKLAGCGDGHGHEPAGPWIVFWLLMLGMLR